MTKETENDSRRIEHLDAWLALTGQTAAAIEPLRLPMLSGSMAPVLPPGATLVIDPTFAGRFGCGDVVVIHDDGRLIAHRVLLRLRLGRWDHLLEMGDAGERGTWRTAADVTGRVTGAVPPEGGAEYDPTSRARARRGLFRHLKSLLARRRVSGPVCTNEPESDIREP